MVICGIDPGVSGSIAIFDTETRDLSAVYDMPVTTRVMSTGKSLKRIDARALYQILISHGVETVFLEEVWSSPQMGVASAFSFGDGFGAVRSGISIAGCDLILVPPATWKPALRLSADKEETRERATALFGSDQYWPLKKHHDRAESALLAVYGARLMANEPMGRITSLSADGGLSDAPTLSDVALRAQRKAQISALIAESRNRRNNQ